MGRICSVCGKEFEPMENERECEYCIPADECTDDGDDDDIDEGLPEYGSIDGDGDAD